MRIRAKLYAMASSEILRMVPASKLAQIRTTDNRPMFKAFVVGHEGEAHGHLVGVGNVVKRWFKSMIAKLHDRIQIGTSLFNGHSESNDTAGRVPLGEVAGKALLSIGGRLSSVVACYIKPEFRNLPLDVASIEADVELEPDRRGAIVTDVDRVTAIALGNSAIETPGFPGATLLGQLQAFAKDRKISQEDYMGEVTIEDVRAFLKAEKVRPSDLFGAELLSEDPAVKGLIETEKRQAVAGEYAHRKRTEEGFDKTRTDLEKKLQEREADLQRMRVEAVVAGVGTLFEKQKGERKLDERQVKFIQAQLSSWKPTNPESAEKEFNAYLDKQIDDYKRIAKDVFGVEAKDGGEKKQDSGTGPDSEKIKGAPEEKYIDPAQNPMIRTAGV